MWPVQPTRRRPFPTQPGPADLTQRPGGGPKGTQPCRDCGHLAAHTECGLCPTCELTEPEEDDQ